MQRIVLAGTHSGCGKTTVTLGILAAFKKKGLEVQPFKAGPDFIDTGLHRLITGRPSRNLDIWMCGKQATIECFKRHAESADIAVIEGVMGMYDGEFSTAMLASTLGAPTILVVDAYGMAESAGAVVKGFASELIAGVIFNRVASDSHFKRLKDSVQNVPVLGYLPRDLDFEIPHRHLGLVVAEEEPIAYDGIAKLADAVIEHIDIDAIVKISSEGENSLSALTPSHLHTFTSSAVKIAVAYDKVFCFYYEDNLDLLRRAGAELIFFSPLSGKNIPADADAVYIGGGYPELYAEALSGNSAMLASVNAWTCSGRPIYAECGGLMYLSQGIYDFDGNFFKMAGIFPFETQMNKGGLHLGYREVILEGDCILGKKGEILRGHEFHYSHIVNRVDSSETNAIYSVRNRSGRPLPGDGYRLNRTLASYVHLHFASNSAIADSFVKYIKEK
ncbi:MAG: cobyrinate a,c-diamide synthase [Dissulfurispiraceae bacterium]